MKLTFSDINPFVVKKSAGISCHVNKDGNLDLHVVVLEYKRGGFEIVLNKTLHSLNDLPGSLDKNIPVSLSYEGKGVINREIGKNIELLPEMLTNVFPNADVKDFYVNSIAGEANGYVAIARKELVADTYKALTGMGYMITTLSLGSFHIANIFQLLPDRTEVAAESISMRFTAGKVQHISFVKTENAQNIQMDGELVKPNEISALSLSLTHWFTTLETKNNLTLSQGQKQEFYFKHLFKISGIAALAFFLVVLLWNYMLFGKYNSANAQYNDKLLYYERYVAEAELLKEALKNKKRFIERNNLNHATNFSQKVDQISGKVPSGCSLQGIQFNQLTRKIRPDVMPAFDQHVAVITGNTVSSVVLNRFIKELKDLTWTKSVTIRNYEQANLMVQGAFEIEIEFD